VTIYMNSLQFAPGDYELSLALAASTGTNGPADRFRIRVR
jgi:hypothetical protein